jgi:HlyD family secretion protein
MYMVKSFLSFITNMVKRVRVVLGHTTVVSSVVILAVVAVWFGVRSNNASKPETIKVRTENITQRVQVSGKVQAQQEASLAFQGSGMVSYIGVVVGDEVKQGKVLATLASDDEQANLLQAQATLANAQAKLNQLVQGSRKEEVSIKEQAVANAQSTVDATYATLPDVIRNVDAVTADAIKNKLATLFVFAGDHYVLTFSSCDQKLQAIVESNRSVLETTLSTFQKSSTLVTSISSQEAIDKAFNDAYTATVATNDLIASISNLLLASCSAQNTSLDTYRASLTLARTNLNTVFADLSAKRSALTTAKNTLLGASRDLTLTKAGSDPISIQAQQALVSQAEAGVAQAEAKLNKTIIRAPFDGVVTDVTLAKGESASASKTAVAMMSKSSFEVEVRIPEIDIAKITLGNKANITLDAYGTGAVFPALVTRINPSAFFEGNVPKYTVIATFIGDDARIKNGMTANVSILTKEIPNALVLPVRFVTVIDETHGTVQVSGNGQVKDVPVVLGVRGENGLLEIKQGLTEGETVVAIQPGERSAQKQTQ